jgi:hypothetical protein
MTIERAIEDCVFTPGQFEIVTAYGSAGDLNADTVKALAKIASRIVVLKRGSDRGEIELVRAAPH